MLIVYSSYEETLICEAAQEKKLLKLYFKEGGRDVEEYTREEVEKGFVEITSKLRTEVTT